jgi:hypothetical protein
VRAQVDRDLTTVSWVDRLLGLIKNLGRHRAIVKLDCSGDTRVKLRKGITVGAHMVVGTGVQVPHFLLCVVATFPPKVALCSRFVKQDVCVRHVLCIDIGEGPHLC